MKTFRVTRTAHITKVYQIIAETEMDALNVVQSIAAKEAIQSETTEYDTEIEVIFGAED
jgi:hypothetical protein